MDLRQLNNLINNLYTDIELIENTLENTSDEDDQYIRTYDHETVSTIRHYLANRIEYRSLALISLEKVGTTH